MYLCARTLLLSRCEATLQSIISESSCIDQETLCLVIFFRAWWSAASWAGVRFLGSFRQITNTQSVSCPVVSPSFTSLSFHVHTVPFFFLRGALTTSFLLLFLFCLFPPTTCWFLDAGSTSTWLRTHKNRKHCLHPVRKRRHNTTNTWLWTRS